MADPLNMSLDQIQAKQQEFIEVLESELKKYPKSEVDLVAVGRSVGLDLILTTEFIVYWVNMGRLDRAWLKVADKLREQVVHNPLKPPPGMVDESALQGGSKKMFSKKQREIYTEIWTAIHGIAEGQNTAQKPFNNRQQGVAFHEQEAEEGYDNIKRVDDLSPYLEKTHYDIIREYFTAYTNYHQYRRGKYLDKQQQDPGGWTEQDAILYQKVFASGLVEMQTLFREVLSAQDEQSLTEVVMGDKYSFSNISASNIIVNSTLERVTQSIGNLPTADTETREALIKLISELKEILKQAPLNQSENAEKIADRVDTLVQEAGKEKPDTEKVEFSLDSLKKAAENIAAVLPTILPIATQIATHIEKLLR